MSRTTLQNTLTEMFGLLASDAVGTPVASLSTAGCVKVYPHEPGAGGVVKPCSVTISPAAIRPTDWMVAVRVYVDDQYPDRAQDLVVDVPVAVSALLVPGYGPDEWDMGWQPELGCWLASSLVTVGREDGF